MKVYLDEMIWPGVAEALRELEHDAAAVADRGAFGESDIAQLARAIQEQRALVTYDLRSFGPLADAAFAARRDHWGIVLIHADSIPGSDLGRLIRALDALLPERPEPDALKNQVIFLQPAPQDRTS